ncbi:MAG: polyhydroxyalkanoic acid system family protein [Myxococcaceae bacterium]|nr:polyhydroxyalkanoic acid system family protein [Myxococcaceae bacterium]MCI0671334.1 polyhydroxyalkanoic acid system family protein [Myxococcaceae bacterium]
MGTMKLDVPHSLPKDEAKKRLAQLVDYWSSKYGVKSQWTGDSATVTGKVMGIALEASFEVRDGIVAGEGTDPGMLLRSKAKQYIQSKMSAFLDPSKNPADLTHKGD